MRVYLKSYGCSANQADGEVIKGCLAQAGIELVESAAAADIVVVNTCAVKGPTENRVIDSLKRYSQDRKLVVAGCLPLTSFDRLLREVRFDGVVGPAAGEGVVEVVERVFKGEKVVALNGALNAKPSLALAPLRSNPVISVIPVNYGCLGSCAYCCVVFARGRLRSYTVEDVVDRVQRDLAAGAKEFWITSQDTGCYGRDVGANLAVLLEALSALAGDFRVRVGMMTPNMVTDIVDKLVAAFGSEKVFKFIHLPVQSGDDEVLQRMRRFYTVQGFKDIVEAFRAAFPQMTLATDVICGFPGETPEAFESTLKLISEVKPDIVNVSKFFPRPRTAAAEMREALVELAEIKRRSTKTAKIAKRIALERNQQWIGWTGEVLIDEKGKISGTWIGRNFAYKPITVRSNENLLGRKLDVRVVKAFSTHLLGVPC
ncbi:MAG: tRNA (N(6)-L-threonylcarbamoyladenosine(37)-C(2))-methylthiotransferase [Candidatus Bathyarchaeota archaeon]|nr:tRNA (N(6)-L-threonylcarbamoyladenosine(37)-C(2))-methylthiotransferase [Candidatus Bathyarchaeota archaeon]